MSAVLVLVPVLGRPERAAAVAASIRASDDRASPLFLASPGDDDEIDACRAVGWTAVMEWDAGHGDYAKKMNHGYGLARAHGYEWAFLGADDLIFHAGWLDACLREHERTLACVIGTNDMGNRRTMTGRHSTHSLVHRDYLDGCGGVIDDPALLMNEAYGHNYCDDEMVQTAQQRGTYVHAREAFVEHLHPNWKKSDDDATYRKGMETFDADRALYESRMALWGRRR